MKLDTTKLIAELPKKVVWKGKLQPTVTIPGTQPIALTSGICRELIEHFLRTGKSIHSGSANTLWVIMDYCNGANLKYTLKAWPKIGYEIILEDALWIPT